MSSVELTPVVEGGRRKVGKLRFSAAAPVTLAGRLMAWVFAVSFGIVLSASFAFYLAATYEIDRTEIQVLTQRMDTVRDWMDSDTLDEPTLYHEVTENNMAPRQIYIRVIDTRRSIFIETPDMAALVPQSLFPDGEMLRLDDRVSGSVKNETGGSFTILSARLAIGDKGENRHVIIQTAVDTTLDQAALVWFRGILAVILMASFFVCLGLAWHISRRELAPLRKITAAASNINSLTLGDRLQLAGMPQELFQLGNEFNKMLDRLETAYSSLRHYADNAAHELRGPVNKMLLEGDVALQGERGEQSYREALEANADEARQLARIVDSILFLARAENNVMTIDRKPLNLAEELELIRTYYEASAEDAGISLTLECPGDLELLADRFLLQRAITNLVSNALSHCEAGCSVIIRARQEGEAVIVEIIDTGEGISDEAKPHVFTRFYRADTARSSSRRIGLGLPITHSIVALHGGRMELESTLGQGTTMRMIFGEI